MVRLTKICRNIFWTDQIKLLVFLTKDLLVSLRLFFFGHEKELGLVSFTATYIMVVSFIDGGNLSIQRKPLTSHKSLTNFIL